jgi:hypothetical protein
VTFGDSLRGMLLGVALIAGYAVNGWSGFGTAVLGVCVGAIFQAWYHAEKAAHRRKIAWRDAIKEARTLEERFLGDRSPGG